jgi:hypothetical protein
MKPKLTWLLAPISLGAFLATWGGWAKLAAMTGYAEVQMLPGQSWSTFNIGIVLPMTVEPFGALAMAVAFNVKVRRWARVVAGVMAITTLLAAGTCQAVVHNLTVAGKTIAPPLIVTVTSVLPVIVLGLGGALAMLSAVRVQDDGTPSGRPGIGFLGRIGTALGDAAASQAERLAARSQSSRDAIPDAPKTLPETPTQPSQDNVPEIVPVAIPASQEIVPVAVQDDVPAAHKAFQEADEETRIQLIGKAKARPGAPSYEKLGREFGTSKSEAGRLGKIYQDRLKADPVIVRDKDQEASWTHPWDAKLAAERAEDGVKVNGYDHHEEVQV